MDPDSLLEENIHCKDYIVGIEKNIIKESPSLEITNYPNPFNSSTTFSVRIPADVHYRTAFIHIFSIDGKRIYTLSISEHSRMQWNGQTTNGEPAPSGVYFYQLLLDDVVCKNGSMILLK
jgi:flagellar hook assembly protein FlgD